VADAGGDFFDLFLGEAQAGENGVGHVLADFFVAVKVDGTGGRVGGGGEGFGDVVEEDGPDEGLAGVRGQLFEHEADMRVDGAFRVVIGGLGAGEGGGKFGEDGFEEAAVAEEVEAAEGVGGGKEFLEFVADAFGTDALDGGGQAPDGGEGVGVDGEIELGGEADGAEEAQVVFGKAFGGVADGADEASLEVGLAADPVVELAGEGVKEEAVNGKVTADGVGLGVGEGDGFGAAAVAVVGFGAVSGDLELVVLFDDDDDAELAADGDGVGKEFFDGGGAGGGGDVVVGGDAAEELVADAATDPVGGVAGGVEAMDEVAGDGGGGLQLPGNLTT